MIPLLSGRADAGLPALDPSATPRGVEIRGDPRRRRRRRGHQALLDRSGAPGSSSTNRTSAICAASSVAPPRPAASGSCCATTTSRSRGLAERAARLRRRRRTTSRVVTPKYLYPDGALNEAGGIIWRDGTGANYGRGAAPTVPYEYRREVDYGSAAALLVGPSFWRTSAGSTSGSCRCTTRTPTSASGRASAASGDVRAARQRRPPRGRHRRHRLTSGHKRHQEINRPSSSPKWERSWREQLPRAATLRRAADRARGRGS